MHVVVAVTPAHPARRSLSKRRNQPATWFQLATVRLTFPLSLDGPLSTFAIDIANMTQGTRNALTCLQNAVGAAGGSLSVTSAYRPQSYQDHIRDVWDKWQAIKDRNDAACAQTKAQVQTEWNRHGLTFQPAAVSNHTSGRAFDANWSPGTLNIDQLANGCSLSRSVPGDDVHFEYTGT